MRKRLVVTILCVFFLFACTWNVKPKSFWEMTPKEKLTYMYQIYNSQYDDYMSMSKMTNLTESQKEVLRKKKKLLTTLEPMIPAYDVMVQNGVPSADQEQKIYDLLNQLQSNLSG